MLFSYNWLQSFFSKKPRSKINSLRGRLPKPEKLVEFLMTRSFEVEEVHHVKCCSAAILPKAKLFNRVKKKGGDWLLDIKVLPNRAPDCFSYIGMSREISAITGLPLAGVKKKKLKEKKSLKTRNIIAIDVKDAKTCSRYTARVMTGVNVGSSPKWLKERLASCGQKSINNIVDIANYVMLETGQPMHVFDFDKIESVNPKSQIPNSKQIPNPKFQTKKIIVRKAQKGEKIITLDNETYVLDNSILVIADSDGPLAIAGIKGGKKAEIDGQTKNIVLESANFNPVIIRRGSRRINLRTDASFRFEHSIDPNTTEIAINRAVALMQESAGGEAATGLADFYPKKVLPKRIKLDLDYVDRMLGIKIPSVTIKNILKRLEFGIVEVRPQHLPQHLLVEAPTFRLDISSAEDLIEEIGRIYGYEKIPNVFPSAAIIPPERNFEIFWEDTVKNILKESGLTEIYSHSFITEKDADIMGYKKENIAEIENPINIDFKYLRPSLLPNLLKSVQTNQNYFKQIKIFELGKVFSTTQERADKKRIYEKRMLSGLITGEAFYEVKGALDLLFNKLGISGVRYDNYQPSVNESKKSLWNQKKYAEINIGDDRVGFFSELSSQILNEEKMEQKIVLFDIDFEILQCHASEEREFRPISPYPAAVRDIAVLLPRNILAGDVSDKIKAAGGALVRNVDLFDIYEGEELADGKKNLSFHIIYQAEDKTLTAKEIDEIQNRIIQSLEKETDWEVRR